MRNRDANWLVDALNKLLNLIVKPGNKNELIVSDSNAILTLNLNASTSGVSRVSTYRVVSVESDHYVCHAWDETTLTEGVTEVMVARPWEHRNSILSEVIAATTYDYTYTNTTTRESDDGVTVETQVIVPYILVTDETQPNPTVICAVTANTGVEVESVPVTLQDINVAGRAWAMVV